MPEVIGIVKPYDEDNTFKWIINASLPLLLKHKVCESYAFNVGDDDDIKRRFRWKLCKGSTLDECFNPPEYKDVWRLILCCAENSSITWNYKISFIKDGEMLHNRIQNCTFFATHREELIFIVFSDEIDQLISTVGEIIISCQLKFVKKNIDNYVKDVSDDMIEGQLRSKLNFEWIFLGKDLSDVEIRVACGKEIPAHKVVLAAASPVFKAMFSSDMLEKKSQAVDMNDISYDAAVEMLRYIYTDSVETQELSLTAEVLAAADKYQLEELKNKCERILGSNLSIKNAVKALRIADMYNAKHLKKKAVDFVKLSVHGQLNYDEISDMILDKAKLSSK